MLNVIIQSPARRHLEIIRQLTILALLSLARPCLAGAQIHNYMYVGMDREKIRDTAFLNSAALEGAQIAYSWKQLEPVKDHYDFASIDDDLAFLSAHGKKLFVQFQDVTFGNARVPAPGYIVSDSEYHGGVAKQYQITNDDDDSATQQGWTIRRWDPVVLDRLGRLYVALGKAIDGRIAGVNTAESSITVGLSGKLHAPGFTFEGYRDGVIANMQMLRRAFSKSVVMQYGNFMPGEWRATNDRGYLSGVYDAAKRAGVAVAGPDLMPFRMAQLQSSYPLIHDAASVVATGVAVQDGNIPDINPATGKRGSIAELVVFAREYLGVSYIFWGREEPYFSTEVLPFLRAGSLR